MVISTVNQVIYNGDGITTAWPYTFRIIDATDIKLTIIDADGTETDVSADYYVDTVNDTVYYPGYAPGAEPPQEDQPPKLQSGQKLLIYRQLPVTQEKDLGEKWPFEVIELGLDKLTMILQQVYGWWGRCLRISPAASAEHPNFDMTFPIEPGKSFRVNVEGTGFEASADPGPYAEVAAEAAETATTAAEAAAAAAALVELQAVYFDNIADMIAANVPVGITASVKGADSVNDGGAAFYNIREKTEYDVNDGDYIVFLDNGNVAEKIVTDGMFNRSVLNFEYVRNQGFKHYYKYADNISAVYGCYMGFTETTNNTFIAMMFPVEYKLNYMQGEITDKAVLVELDDSFTEIRRSGELTLYHGNALTYHEGKIYSTGMSSGSSSVNKIVVIDYDTLTVDREISTAENYRFIYFKDGYMYGGTTTYVDKLSSNGSQIERITFPQALGFHSLKPYKDMYIGTRNYPNGVYLVSPDFKILKKYSFPYIGERGEVKDIAVVGDNIFIPYNDRSYIRGVDYELSECYAAILHVNLVENVKQSIYVLESSSNMNSVYVDTTTTDTMQTGEQSHPFSTIMQAIVRGYRYIVLTNSDGLYFFGTNDVSIDGSNNAVVHLGDCRYGKINIRYCVVQDNSACANNLTCVDMTLNGCAVNSTLNSANSRINSDTDCTVLGNKGTETNFPVTNPQSAYQKYTIIDSTDGRISVPFSAFAPGGYFINIRADANGVAFVANMSACNVDSIKQYFVTASGSHVFTGYLDYSFSGGKIVPTLSNCFVDGVAVTPSIKRLVITHIP